MFLEDILVLLFIFFCLEIKFFIKDDPSTLVSFFLRWIEVEGGLFFVHSFGQFFPVVRG